MQAFFLSLHNLISSGFWFLVGLGFTLGGLRYGFGTWREPGPGLLPCVFGIILASLSASLFLVTLGSSKKETARFWAATGSWKPILYTLFSLVCYMLLLKPIGFVLVTFLLAFFLLRFIGQKGWFISVLIAVIFSFSCYVLFGRLLGSPLPTGQIYGSTLWHTSRV